MAGLVVGFAAGLVTALVTGLVTGLVATLAGAAVAALTAGRAEGFVWGDAVYTLDSNIGAAAVHGGLLKAGETKAIKVWIVPAPSAFVAAERNGIQSGKWGKYHTAFFMQLADPARSPLKINEPLE